MTFSAPRATWYDLGVDPTTPLARGTFRATITGVGRPGPIEERVGRRLVRIVDPSSKEGVALLRSGQVTFVGPEGRELGCRGIKDARRLLRERLERRLEGAPADPSVRHAIEDGLIRLDEPKRR
jgi:hypothetical protein